MTFCSRIILCAAHRTAAQFPYAQKAVALIFAEQEQTRPSQAHAAFGRESRSAKENRKQLPTEHDPERNIRGAHAITPHHRGVAVRELQRLRGGAQTPQGGEYPRRHKIEVTGIITPSAPLKRKQMMQMSRSEGIHKGARPSPLMRKGRSGTVNRRFEAGLYPPRERNKP